MRRLLPWLLVSSVGCQPTCTPGSPGVPGPSRLSVAGTLSASLLTLVVLPVTYQLYVRVLEAVAKRFPAAPPPPTADLAH